MNDPNSYGYQENATDLSVAEQQRPAVLPSEYKFTPDELRVLGECNKESFFQRSLPLGTTFGLGAYVAVQKGHLKPNPRFGPFPKVTLAVMVGYFIGKLSYQQACAEKLMALPGSYIGQLLRERKDGKVVGGTSRGPMGSKPGTTMFGANPSDIYSDAGPGSSLDLDTDRPLFNDDSYRPGSTAPVPAPEVAPRNPSLSYDDLRRKNRDDYKGSKQDPYRTELGAPPPVQRMRTEPPAPAPPAPTNKYGDVME
ncbi:OCIA domain-containing protein 1-like [Spodoptera litura]|uniref:OCIA domain-containing protein 1-like n=1 Tax=Spodoptera litura TaxID=69820 RepID=A0A9J7IY85_SPOLT|nr:OCIA domain-containing protein 1-like [Spodoptera litura]